MCGHKLFAELRTKKMVPVVDDYAKKRGASSTLSQNKIGLSLSLIQIHTYIKLSDDVWMDEVG